MVSRLSPTKGVEHLLDAIAAAAVSHPKLRALIVGEGLVAQDGVVMTDRVYLDSLIARAKRLGIENRVVFTGYRSDIPALLADTTVFALPSLTEGLSNVVLEAMAAGLPVIATRVGGTPEIIRDGLNGLLVPPSDPASLKDALTRVLDDPAMAKGLGEAAKRSIEERFSMARMVNSTEALYTDLLARKRRSPRRTGARVLRLPGALLAGRRL
jgi:glycosyltransferase involved in cell wall biosynthesis